MTRKPLFSKHEKAQSLVEFAISLTLLLMLLAAAVDFGIALYSYVSIRDAAQEGALYASIHPEASDYPDIRDRVRTASDSPVDLSAFNLYATPDDCPSNENCITVQLIGDDACEGTGSLITVTVIYRYQLIMPLLPDMLGVTEIPLRASVTNAILQPACES